MAQQNKENKSNYFSHDSNARNSDKLIRLRMRWKAAGYGVYFMILERLREEPNYMSVKDYNMIAFDLREDASMIKSVVEDFGLFAFTEDGKCFYSESFNRRMAVKDEKARKQSEAGRKAMQRRWGKTRAADAEVTINNEKVNGAAEDKANGADEPNVQKCETNTTDEENGGNPAENGGGNNDVKVSETDSGCNLLISNLGKNDNKKRKEKESKEKESKEIIKEKQKQKEKNTHDAKLDLKGEAENKANKPDEPNAPEMMKPAEATLEEKCLRTFKYFNEMTEYYKSEIKPVRVFTEERRRKLEVILRRFTSKDLAHAMRNAMTSDYLNGKTKRRKIPADFDWIFDEKNFIKIFEGSV